MSAPYHEEQEDSDEGHEGKHMKIAACTKMLGDYDLIQAVRLVGMIGYEGIEIFCIPQHLAVDVDEATAREAKRIADYYGVKVVCLATYVAPPRPGKGDGKAELAAFRRYCELADILGAPFLRIGQARNADIQATPGYLDEVAVWTRECCRIAAEHGKTGVFETHTGNPADSVKGSLDMLARVDAPNLGITWDPGSLAVDPSIECGPEAVRALRDVIVYAQLHDFQPLPSGRTYVFSGEGQVDCVGTVAALKEIGFDGYIGAECHRPTDEWYDGRGVAEQEYRRILPMLA